MGTVFYFFSRLLNYTLFSLTNLLEFQYTGNFHVQRSVFTFIFIYLCFMYIICNCCIHLHYNSIALESRTVFLKRAQSFSMQGCAEILAGVLKSWLDTLACQPECHPRKNASVNHIPMPTQNTDLLETLSYSLDT